MIPEMTEDDAAWIREQVWTDGMRRVEFEVWPGYYSRCECQRDICYSCDRGAHEMCNAIPRQSDEGMIADKTGVHPACFKDPYEHVTIDGAPKATTVAQVWLADRICRWSCQCACAGTLPMSAINAGWIRRNAWTKSFAERMTRAYGDQYGPCKCQEDITEGGHRDCPDRRDRPWPEGWVNGGVIVDQRDQLLDSVAVWLADRACRRLPQRVAPVAVPGGLQDALPGFDTEGTPR